MGGRYSGFVKRTSKTRTALKICRPAAAPRAVCVSQKIRRPVSALGHKRTLRYVGLMSALPPTATKKADIATGGSVVANGSCMSALGGKVDMRPLSTAVARKYAATIVSLEIISCGYSMALGTTWSRCHKEDGF